MRCSGKEMLFTLFCNRLIILACALAIFVNSHAQKTAQFSDSLNQKKLKTVSYSLATIYTGSLIGLNQLWYADYDRSSFQFFNDNRQWQGLDKVGHIYSAYLGGSIGYHAFRHTGMSRKKSLIYGGSLGFVFLTTVEVFDGFSKEWGFSWGDVVANGLGTALFVGQEYYLGKQIAQMKYSFSSSSYRAYRPNVLGENYTSSLFKDYNGQTYWLSFNLNALSSNVKPKWLSVAFGYGADGMVSARGEFMTQEGQKIEPFRQYYIGLDVDLSKIKTPYKGVNSILKAMNFIKFPALTYQFNSSGKPSQFHWLFF